MASAVATMLDPGGAVVQVDAPDRRAGQGIRNTSPFGEDQVFQRAGF